MPRRENGCTPATVSRVLGQSRELGQQVADLADRIAESEDKVASTLEEAALLRPHARRRLHSAAEEARLFADRERDHSRRLRRAVGAAGADPAD